MEQSEGTTQSAKQDFRVFWSDVNYQVRERANSDYQANCVSRLLNSTLRHDKRKSGCEEGENSATFSVEQQRTILNQINGSFKSGELTAIIGPSGAGKTSLLNLLGRRCEQDYSGQLLVENANRPLKIRSIPQHDRIPEYLSVRENLVFASRLKNVQKNYNHSGNAERVSSLLGLDGSLDTPTRAISGGQLKRLAIAQELLSTPDILILDEPTSGLDSYTCNKTLSVLKDLTRGSVCKATEPIAIVLSIHQPEQEVFAEFDKIYVLAHGGTVIYDGSPGRCVEFLEKHTLLKLPEKDYNPALFLIEIASGEHGQEPIVALQRQVRVQFQEELKSSTLFTKMKASKGIFIISSRSEIELHDHKTSEEVDRKKSLHIDQRLAKSSAMNQDNFWLKTGILWQRCWYSMIRDPKQLIARTLFHFLLPFGMAFIMGSEPGRANACPKYSPYYNLYDLVTTTGGVDKLAEEELSLTMENIGLLFIMTYALISTNVAIATLTSVLEMPNSLKEHHNGWYSLTCHIVARSLVEIPPSVILPAVCGLISFQVTSQLDNIGQVMSGEYRVLLAMLALILGVVVGQTLGLIFGTIYFDNIFTALFIPQAFLMALGLLSGFIARTKNMYKFVVPLTWISIQKHVVNIMTVARWGFEVCACNQSEITGSDVELLGVPDKLKSFTKFWASSIARERSSVDGSDMDSNDTNKDIFQLFAKQISLFNTYGIEIKSCRDVVPFQLHHLQLSEGDLLGAFVALAMSWLIANLVLLLAVKLVVRYRTSL